MTGEQQPATPEQRRIMRGQLRFLSIEHDNAETPEEREQVLERIDEVMERTEGGDEQ